MIHAQQRAGLTQGRISLFLFAQQRMTARWWCDNTRLDARQVFITHFLSVWRGIMLGRSADRWGLLFLDNLFPTPVSHPRRWSLLRSTLAELVGSASSGARGARLPGLVWRGGLEVCITLCIHLMRIFPLFAAVRTGLTLSRNASNGFGFKRARSARKQWRLINLNIKLIINNINSNECTWSTR